MDWKQLGLDREIHQDPDRESYNSDEEGTVVDHAADELELIAVLKRDCLGDFVWVFQQVVPPKGMITEVNQSGRFYRMSTGRAAH